jgi:putative flippase GtrA
MEPESPPQGTPAPGFSWLTLVLEWIRHRASALIATGVDFAIMIGCVEILHFSPVAGTVAGALFGAITNFLLGRHWVFHRATSRVVGQILRYALVSGISLGLNAAGEYLLVFRAGVGYVLARAMVAFAVSNLWNYPLHKFLVFGRRARDGNG